MADEEFVHLTKVREYFRMINGKKVKVKAHEDNRRPEMPEAMAHRAIGVHQAHNAHVARNVEQRRQDYVPRRAAKESAHEQRPATGHTAKHAAPHELEGANHRPVDHNVSQHHKDAAARMSDSAVVTAAAKIRMKDEEDWTPLERAIFAQIRHRGLKLHAKFSNVSLSNMSFDDWWGTTR